MVIGGNHGSGFSVATISPEMAKELPKVLRFTADEIERSMK
jgi:hypothetical protein